LCTTKPEVSFLALPFAFRPTTKLNIRNGFTLEDFVNGIAVGILGDADRWQRLNYEKQQQKKQEEA
jgi:hypothetical protein